MNTPDPDLEKPAGAEKPMRVWPWVAGLCCAGLVLAVLFPPRKVKSSFFSDYYSPISRIQSDMRTLGTVLEAYMVDANQYPACARGEEGMNYFLPPDDPARSIYTFRRAFPGSADTLTTPVSFLNAYPSDPFCEEDGTCVGYFNAKDSGWILWSPGPDHRYEIDPESDYSPYESNPTPRLLWKAYDSTNGAGSRGDLWRVKQ